MWKQLGAGIVMVGLVGALTSAEKPEAAERQKAPAKRAARPYLGIAGEPAAAEEGGKQGVLVRDVAPDGPAARAGLKAGDVITGVGDRKVADMDSLVNALSGHKPGEKVAFQVSRDGQEKPISVTLGERPRTTRGGEGVPTEGAGVYLGVQAVAITPAVKERLNLSADRGVAVVDVMPGSPAAKAGIRRGDVITAAGGQAVSAPRNLREAVREAGAGKAVNLTLVRGGEKQEVKVTPAEAPVDGLESLPIPFPGRPGGRTFNLPVPGTNEKVSALEQRVKDLEKRVRELERQRTQPQK
jgi:S1-C subfamily serine protease